MERTMMASPSRVGARGDVRRGRGVAPGPGGRAPAHRAPRLSRHGADRGCRHRARSVLTERMMELTKDAGVRYPTPAEVVRSRSQVNLVAVIEGGARSPYGPDWKDVLGHVAMNVGFLDDKIKLDIVEVNDLVNPDRKGAASEAIRSADAVVAVALQGPSPAHAKLLEIAQGVTERIAVDCSSDLERKLTSVGGFQPTFEGPAHHIYDAPLRQSVLSRVPVVGRTTARRLQGAKVFETMQELWSRRNSDDMVFAMLLLTDELIRPVDVLPRQDPGLMGVYKMLRWCSGPVLACVRDPECKAGLDALTAVGINDQVASYRTIVSYETKEFEEFSLCVLQKHNCLGNTALLPSMPDPPPMERWRGQELTWELAERILFGWLVADEATGGESDDSSWMVVGGKNAAYDQFPCQFQLFYRGKGKHVLWYDPVFKVTKLDGEQVWRRRHYRVRRGSTPGRFFFSVLDNGVTSNEYWRIIDAADDLSFAVFYYSGAASAAGISYQGSVVATRDGTWPGKEGRDRIDAALRAAGIEPWELSTVDNSSCTGCAELLASREGI
ncbi:unnamed protein product [Pedinophyceae sp. YPF-701]|nr:unnamed protein product [Pedinophyceae sp. YPF-701]